MNLVWAEAGKTAAGGTVLEAVAGNRKYALIPLVQTRRHFVLSNLNGTGPREDHPLKVAASLYVAKWIAQRWEDAAADGNCGHGVGTDP
jgi:hypothetical protein